MRRTLTLIAVATALTLSLAGPVAAAPGNGKNTVFILNNCDSGIGEITLVSQASLNGRFATAHVVGSNRPAPLISLDYKVSLGADLLESGGYAHKHPQQGQPVVTCVGSFAVEGLTFEITVTAFFPAGS